MKISKLILVITSTTFLFACNDSSEQKETQLDEGLIPANVVVDPTSLDSSNVLSPDEMPSIDFVDSFHDFGTVTAGEVVEHEFVFKNNGGIPLIISQTIASCGCTIPEKPTDPILPGEEGKIKVAYNSAGKEGLEEKTITVLSNAAESRKVLKIKTIVNPK